MSEEKEKKEPKEKIVSVKLTGKHAGRLTINGGFIYCDDRLPKGQKHLRVTESEAQKLIAARAEDLKRQRIKDDCDLVIA